MSQHQLSAAEAALEVLAREFARLSDQLQAVRKGDAANDVKDDYKRLLYQYGDHLPGCVYRLGYKHGDVSIHDEQGRCDCGWYEIRFNVKKALEG